MKYYCKRCNQMTVEFQDDEEGYLCDPCGLFYDESELEDGPDEDEELFG